MTPHDLFLVEMGLVARDYTLKPVEVFECHRCGGRWAFFVDEPRPMEGDDCDDSLIEGVLES